MALRPFVRPDRGPDQIAVTWLGHSTFLIATPAGHFLTDPALGARVGPVAWAGPRRPGVAYTIEKTDNTLGWTKPAVDEFHNLGYVDELAYTVDCVIKNKEPIYGCSGRLAVTSDIIILSSGTEYRVSIAYILLL